MYGRETRPADQRRKQTSEAAPAAGATCTTAAMASSSARRRFATHSPPAPLAPGFPFGTPTGRSHSAAVALIALRAHAKDRRALGEPSSSLLDRLPRRARLLGLALAISEGAPARRDAGCADRACFVVSAASSASTPSRLRRLHRREERRVRARDPGRPHPGRLLRRRLGGRDRLEARSGSSDARACCSRSSSC